MNAASWRNLVAWLNEEGIPGAEQLTEEKWTDLRFRRTDEARTEAVAKDFKVFFHKVPTGSSYTLDHTTLSYLFDPQGRLRVAVKHDMSAADLAADVRLLLIP